jgi:Ni,Fe-hydrogenase III large subunit/Ni,Fe-hydrogenase III component G
MSEQEALRRSLDIHLQGRVTGSRVVRGNEVHLVTRATEIPAVARILREQGAELALMAGTDRRLDLGTFEVHYLFVHRPQNLFLHITVAVPPEDPTIVSLATFDYPASRFEREIADLLGIRFHGHPDPRPLVRHAFWPDDFFPLRKDAGVRDFQDDGRPFPFQQVGGEGVYEIPVGPVHAGVIEPGHFRFSVVGETVIDMTSRLYFTHKGTEKLFEGRAPMDGLALAERISGDTSVGHALAYCEALERLAGSDVPVRAKYLRVLMLELERLYNHVADFGMIANDCGFAAAHSHCFRIRERLFRLNKRLTGHRLLRGCIVPGGIAVDIPGDLAVVAEIDEAYADFGEIVDITLGNTLVRDRLEGTGRLTTRTARGHGVLGFVARASGIDVDARRDHPFAAYGELEFRVPVFESGDVEARTLARVEEAGESVGLIKQAISRLPAGPLSIPLGPLPAYEAAFGVVEGWRGTIIHWVMADAAGALERVKVLDPSFLNWRALSYALLKNIVPDFPLCNKSFNQSYSGNDL